VILDARTAPLRRGCSWQRPTKIVHKYTLRLMRGTAEQDVEEMGSRTLCAGRQCAMSTGVDNWGIPLNQGATCTHIIAIYVNQFNEEFEPRNSNGSITSQEQRIINTRAAYEVSLGMDPCSLPFESPRISLSLSLSICLLQFSLENSEFSFQQALFLDS
jgi:hypothetical protein